MDIVKLTPAYKSIIWGGNKLKTEYGKVTDLSPLAEAWELAFHKDGKNLLEDGTPLCDVVTEAELGENCRGFDFFPVLVKFIDAQDKLSVQVHPNDEYALKHENSLGKTEMWYIVDADEGAGIYLGFKQDITKEQFVRAIEEKTLTDYLKFIPVKKGESYFIPSGTIHAICSGCLICEIQQNSNITYRVYDYGRRDKNGNERELHVAKAIEVTNLNALEPKELNIEVKDGTLKGINKFFTATYVNVDGKKEFAGDKNSFRCFTCLDGEGMIGDMPIKKGESVFVPATLGDFVVTGNFTAIMTTIRKYYLKNGAIENDLGEIIAEGNDEKELLKKCGLTASDILNK
ncbi:MAG: class I mannose-6-phosphate isomerase [Clostridia bacterium]|nr:class I mannose-6-phosphate isomerase [Clostridia bacterium]